MANKLFGRATIVVDGQVLDTFRGASIDIGGVKRNPQPGANSTGGFTEELQPSKVECEIQMDASLSLTALGDIENATVQFRCDTGQVYLVVGAYCAEPPTATEGDGKVKMTFQGPAAVEA